MWRVWSGEKFERKRSLARSGSNLPISSRLSSIASTRIYAMASASDATAFSMVTWFSIEASSSPDGRYLSLVLELLGLVGSYVSLPRSRTRSRPSHETTVKHVAEEEPRTILGNG